MHLTNLMSFTAYNVTVYVRLAGGGGGVGVGVEFPPSAYATAHTKMSPPSPPWNVTVRQLSHADVQVRPRLPSVQL